MQSLIATFKLDEPISSGYSQLIIDEYKNGVGIHKELDERPCLYLNGELIGFINEPYGPIINELIDAGYQDYLFLEVLSLLKTNDDSVEVFVGLYLDSRNAFENEDDDGYEDDDYEDDDYEPSIEEAYEASGLDYHRIDLGDHVEYHMDVGGYIINDEGEYVDPDDYQRDHYRW